MKNQYLFLILIIMLLGCTNESKEFSKLTGQAINNNLNDVDEILQINNT